MPASRRDGNGGRDPRHRDGHGAVRGRAVAESTVHVEAPATDRVIGEDGTGVVRARADRRCRRDAGNQHRRRARVHRAVTELALAIPAPALDGAADHDDALVGGIHRVGQRLAHPGYSGAWHDHDSENGQERRGDDDDSGAPRAKPALPFVAGSGHVGRAPCREPPGRGMDPAARDAGVSRRNARLKDRRRESGRQRAPVIGGAPGHHFVPATRARISQRHLTRHSQSGSRTAGPDSKILGSDPSVGSGPAHGETRLVPPSDPRSSCRCDQSLTQRVQRRGRERSPCRGSSAGQQRTANRRAASARARSGARVWVFQHQGARCVRPRWR